MVHIKSDELCERCKFGMDRCLEMGPDGEACRKCEMNRGLFAGMEGDAARRVVAPYGYEVRDYPSVACGDRADCQASAIRVRGKGCGVRGAVVCVCDEIADGTPCEFFREADDG